MDSEEIRLGWILGYSRLYMIGRCRFEKLKAGLYFLYCFICVYRFNLRILYCVVVMSWFNGIVKSFVHLRHDTSRFCMFSSSLFFLLPPFSNAVKFLLLQ
jgi:hypothetical protein